MGDSVSDFPMAALDPSGKMVSVLVTPDGRLVTDQAPLPAEVQPYGLSGAIRVNADGEVLL